MDILNIGYGNIVLGDRVIAIVSSDSAPIKRLISQAREDEMLIDATYGRKTRAVVICDSGHVILSALQAETIGGNPKNNIAKIMIKGTTNKGPVA